MTFATDWQGKVGDVWAEEWQRTDRSFAGLSPNLDAAILAAAPTRAFRAVDVGCGAGLTSLTLAAARPNAEVIGIDLSAGLVAAAKERAGEQGNVQFLLGDAVGMIATQAPVDLIVSRHGVMFFNDPVAGFSALRAAAAPDAALVFSCFRKVAENPWAAKIGDAAGGDAATAAVTTGPGPFAFGDPDHVREILDRAGWREIAIGPADWRYLAGEGDDPIVDAVDYFSRIGPAARALRQLPAAEHPGALDRIATVCRRYLQAGRVEFPAAAWIVSARNRSEETA